MVSGYYASTGFFDLHCINSCSEINRFSKQGAIALRKIVILFGGIPKCSIKVLRCQLDTQIIKIKGGNYFFPVLKLELLVDHKHDQSKRLFFVLETNLERKKGASSGMPFFKIIRSGLLVNNSVGKFTSPLATVKGMVFMPKAWLISSVRVNN